jgi:hypothetical protein
MSKCPALLKSKKFWTLVASIVAAFSAFFLTSCVSAGSVLRRGVHHDTVEYQFKIRSRNFQTFAQCQEKFSTNFQVHSTPKFFPSIPAFGNSTKSAMTTFQTVAVCSGDFLPPTFRWSSYSRFLSPSSITKLTSFTIPTPFSLATVPQYSSRPICRIFGEKCLALFLPIAFVKRSRRRGGRKGRPKGTKTVPLGGSHL